jgi:hypothetical protein
MAGACKASKAGAANPDPEYFSQLVESTGLSQGRLSEVIGSDPRSIRRWMKGERKYPYAVQYTLECVVLMP